MAAREVIGAAQRRSKNGWFNEECQRITNEENAARSLKLISGTRKSRELVAVTDPSRNNVEVARNDQYSCFRTILVDRTVLYAKLTFSD